MAPSLRGAAGPSRVRAAVMPGSVLVLVFSFEFVFVFVVVFAQKVPRPFLHIGSPSTSGPGTGPDGADDA